jgi:hypothetical protein
MFVSQPVALWLPHSRGFSDGCLTSALRYTSVSVHDARTGLLLPGVHDARTARVTCACKCFRTTAVYILQHALALPSPTNTQTPAPLPLRRGPEPSTDVTP